MGERTVWGSPERKPAKLPAILKDPSFQETSKTQGKQTVFEKNDG